MNPDNPNDEGGKPVVTFALFAFSQQRFIRQAVEGALSQTYRPLEIILSDDCSSDGTFEIMRSLASEYDGCHKVVLNRNSRTLGIGGHVNKIMDLATGRLIVAAAGDDISLPHRVERLTASWLINGHPSVLFSRFQVIDADGEQLDSRGWDGAFRAIAREARHERKHCLQHYVKEHRPGAFGATEAWDPRLFEVFGRLPPKLVQEDQALTFRAWLSNGVAYVDDLLVLYRTHGANVWYRRLAVDRSVEGFKRLEELSCFRSKSDCTLLCLFRRDLRTARTRQLLPDVVYRELDADVRKQAQIAFIRGRWWEARWVRRARYAVVLLGRRGDRGDRLWAIPRLLPASAFLLLRSCASRAAGVVRWARAIAVSRRKARTAGA